MVVVIYRCRRREVYALDLCLDVAVLRCWGDAEPMCLGEVVSVAAALLWTFGPPLRPRLGGAPSSVAGKMEVGVQEFRLLAGRG